jgi:hypothetical protein
VSFPFFVLGILSRINCCQGIVKKERVGGQSAAVGVRDKGKGILGNLRQKKGGVYIFRPKK